MRAVTDLLGRLNRPARPGRPGFLRVAVVVALVAVASPAGAGVTPSGDAGASVTQPSRDTAGVDAFVGAPGAPGGGVRPSVSGGPVVSTSGTAERMCRNGGQQIDCTSGAGSWSSQLGCYVTFVGDTLPVSVGGTGAVGEAEEGMDYYVCVPPGGGPGSVIQLPAGDAAAAAAAGVVVDPEVVARSAVESMGLRAVGIGIVPEPGPDRVGLVGMPVWLWVSDVGPQTWGPVTASASVGVVSATATARVRDVVWDLGDGTTVTCATPGVVYEDRYGDADSPECGHRYERTSVDEPGMAYTVTATTRWDITWSATTGASGVIPLDLTAETQIRVGELQVLLQ